MAAGEPDPHLSRDDLFTLYKIAVEEYRFQVLLNWRRSQYYLALNLAIIGVGAGLLQAENAGRLLPACLFAVGLVTTFLSVLASATQSIYYSAARAGKLRIENALQLRDLSLRTTPGMGSLSKRMGTIKAFTYGLLSVIAIVDLIGLIYSLTLDRK